MTSSGYRGRSSRSCSCLPASQDESFHAVPGVNQVSQATTLAKTSVHVVLTSAYTVTGLLVVSAERSCHRRLGLAGRVRRAAVLIRTGSTGVIDLFCLLVLRSYRMLGTTKAGRIMICAICRSSNRMVDHLVGYYPSLHDGSSWDLPALTHHAAAADSGLPRVSARAEGPQ
jgi:hypothetical protein